MEQAPIAAGPLEASVGLRWDDPEWYPCRCPQCGWQGMSNETAGGGAIADTGDYAEAVCPACIAPGGDYEEGKWIPVEDIPQPNAQGQPT